MGNLKNTKSIGKPLKESSTSDKLAKYASAPYFRKKDKKAAEFLQKHPVPANFLK